MDESEIIEQNQILASIQHRNRPIGNVTKLEGTSKSIEISIDPNKPLSSVEDDIFNDVFNIAKIPKLFENSSDVTFACKKSLEELSKPNKVIEITIDSSKMKDPGDVDIFSDVFTKKEETQKEVIFRDVFENEEMGEEDDDVLMSDTSSESSSENLSTVHTVTNATIEKIPRTTLTKQSVTNSNSEETTKNVDNVTQNSLVKEIFDDVDEASGDDAELISDSSDDSVEDLGKVSEFLSETRSETKSVGNKSSDIIESTDSNRDETKVPNVESIHKSSIKNLQELKDPPEKNVDQSLKDNSVIDLDNARYNEIVVANLPEAGTSSKDGISLANSSIDVTPLASTSAAVSTIKQIIKSNEISDRDNEEPSTSGVGSKTKNYFQSTLNETQTKKLLEYQVSNTIICLVSRRNYKLGPVLRATIKTISKLCF